MNDLSTLLGHLGLSESEILLFQALLNKGNCTAQELIKITQIKRPTAYYALRQLIDKGLIFKIPTFGKEKYQAHDPQQIHTLIKIKREEIDALGKEADDVIRAMKKDQKQYSGIPQVFFYEGLANMKLAISETIYCRSGHIDSIAPANNFFWEVGQEFSGRYIQDRVARGITTRNLWEKPLEPEILLRSYKGLSQVRILPETMRGAFATTTFLYDDCVMYISSKENGYVLVVRSQEHYDLMKAMYETLWATSEEVKI